MGAQPTLRSLLILALGWAGIIGSADAVMPHISQCRLCHRCHLGDSPPEGSSGSASASAADSSATASSATAAATVKSALPYTRTLSQVTAAVAAGGGHIAATTAKEVLPLKRKRPPRAPMYDPELDPLVPIQYKPSSYRPHLLNETASLPECAECYGCHQNLTLISENIVFLNNTYSSEMGATNSWIFRTKTNMTPSGEAVVKVYCIPISKRVTGSKPTCNPVRIAEIMRHLMALDKLSQECGFTDLIPRMWLAPVSGILPGVGYHIHWWGLWMEYVEGVSLENVLFKGIPKRLPLETIADLFNNRLNSTRVVYAAIFDLLTSQCDRHAQNLLVQEDGNFKLIDNESCLQHMWRNCAFDSMLVPTTQKQEIVRLANHYVLKLPNPTGGNTVPHVFADPRLLFDYRCYLPEGREQMGTQYPPQIDTCMKRIASMTPKEIVKHYGFPEERVANNLLTRATDMVTRGFEWAAKYGQPQNALPKRYRFQPKCCRIGIDKTQFQCAHPWKPSVELPFGNAITGQAWDKDRPDPGSYEGGTFPEDGELGANATVGTAVGVAATGAR